MGPLGHQAEKLTLLARMLLSCLLLRYALLVSALCHDMGHFGKPRPQRLPHVCMPGTWFGICKQEANTIISMVVITMVRPTSAISNNSTSTSLHQFVCTWTDETYQYDNYTFVHVFYTPTSARATLPSAGTRLREYKESYFLFEGGGSDAELRTRQFS